jgi:hypothetical protein
VLVLGQGKDLRLGQTAERDAILETSDEAQSAPNPLEPHRLPRLRKGALT